jgi:DNA-binding transcriptional MerR regulator
MIASEELAQLRLTIGPVAQLAGCSPSWVRKLEQAGVIGAAERTATGRRVYRLADVEAIRRTLAAGREAGQERTAAA